MNLRAIAYSACSILLFLCLLACNKQAPEEKSTYQKKNEAFIDKIDADSSYNKLQYTFEKHPIYYKSLETAPNKSDALYPYQNSTVQVSIETKLITGEVVLPKQDIELTITRMHQTPQGLWAPKGHPKGLQIALLNMYVGDHWEVVVPWQLGYDQYNFQDLVPAHSTLIYDIKLLKIIKR